MWYVTFSRGNHKSLGTSDYNKALKVFKELEREYLKGRLIRIEKQEMKLFADFKSEYLDIRKAKTKNTYRADRLALDRFQEFYGNKPMAGISSKKLDEYKAFLKVQGKTIRDRETGNIIGREPLKVNSCNAYIRHLKIALKTASKWGYIKKDLLEEFKQTKVDLAQPIYMERHEVKRLLEAASKHEYMREAIPVMIYCGISRAEIIGQIMFGEDYIEYKRKKTGKLIHIPIHSELKPYIQHLGTGIRRLVPWSHPDTLSHYFGKVVEESGLKGITPHKVRHTFAVLLLLAGADIGTVSELLGHQDISVTKKFYGYIVDGLKRKTIELLKITAD